MREFKVQPIRNGTVIDHITPGAALRVLRMLGLPAAGSSSPVSVAINVASEKHEQKDMIKIEDRELDEQEMRRVALIAPHATVSIVRNFEVSAKTKVELPSTVEGLVRCENAGCVTNAKEPVKSRFQVVSREPPVLRCSYCGREVEHVVRGMAGA